MRPLDPSGAVLIVSVEEFPRIRSPLMDVILELSQDVLHRLGLGVV